MSVALDTVLVPVSFEPDTPTSLAMDRAIEVRPQHWVVATEATIEAIKMATRLVSETGTVHLVHATVDLRPTAAMHGPVGVLIPANIEQLHAASRRHAVEVLGTLAKRFCPDARLELHAAPGRAIDVVLDTARTLTADMIVVAGSGRNRVERMFVGSTVDKLVRQATCPVLVVPG